MDHESNHPSLAPAIPLACDPLAIPPDQRAGHRARALTLFRTAAQERRELPDGMAFRLAASDYELATAFIAQERHCCPFLHFTLDLAPHNGPLWLRITGPAGAKAALLAGLDAVFAQAEQTGA